MVQKSHYKNAVCLMFVAACLAPFVSHLPNASGQSQIDFPIEATVIGAKAPVHSGPAQVHYETDHLARGSKVKVFRLDPGGWCAIEPPKRSFSIIPAGQIEQTDVDMGIIRSDDTVAWVGTLLGTVGDPMWQVKLKKDETVKILGMIETPGSNGEPNQAWFQIAPPAGEFRWIHLSELAQDNQSDVRTAAQPPIQNPENTQDSLQQHSQVDHRNNDVKPATTRPDSSSMLREMSQFPNQNLTVQKQNTQERVARNNQSEIDNNQTSHATESTSNQNGWKPARNPTQDYIVGNTNLNSSTQRPSQSDSDIPLRPINENSNPPNRPLQDQVVQNLQGKSPASSASKGGSNVQQLDLELAIEMTKDPASWNFQPLRQRATTLKSQTGDSVQRIAIDQFLAKVDKFQQGSQSGPSGTPSTIRATGINDQSEKSSSELVGDYDAYGVLEELVRDSGMGQSTYVLRNDLGKITHHVQATPGLNLHRYLKKKIGIIGQRGFNQNLNIDHVTANRIVEMNRFRR